MLMQAASKHAYADPSIRLIPPGWWLQLHLLPLDRELPNPEILASLVGKL